jgi:pyridoxine 5'-phosphate synthase
MKTGKSGSGEAETGLHQSDVCSNPWKWWRDQMPITAEWAYFDHAAVAPLSGPAAEASRDFADQAAFQGDTVWPQWAAQVEHLRSLAAQLLSCDSAEVCMVPEKRQELTTEGGLDVLRNFQTLGENVQRLQNNGSVVSLFIDPDKKIIEASAATGAKMIELHTGAFCDETDPDKAAALLDELVAGAELAHRLGLQVNAGHGINLDNIAGILNIPHLDTLNIGHSIIARAVFQGLDGAVTEMLRAIRDR